MQEKMNFKRVTHPRLFEGNEFSVTFSGRGGKYYWTSEI